MEQGVFRDRLLELTLARLERAEKLLERAHLILPRFGEPTRVLGPHADPRVFDQLARDVAAFLEEGE
jgi:hypothetical protein